MARATSVCSLTDGWAFKQADDASENAWLPVKKVPTNVHLDLIDHAKYVAHVLRYFRKCRVKRHRWTNVLRIGYQTPF